MSVISLGLVETRYVCHNVLYPVKSRAHEAQPVKAPVYASKALGGDNANLEIEAERADLLPSLSLSDFSTPLANTFSWPRIVFSASL